MYIGIAFWDCGEMVVSAWVNGEPVIVPAENGEDSIHAEIYINHLGEYVVGECPDDAALKKSRDWFLTFSGMVSRGVATVTAFLEKAVENARKFTRERVKGICIAVPITFDEREISVLQKAAERIKIPITLMYVGDVMAYLYASSERRTYEPNRFGVLHNDSAYAEFGIYELRDQEIVKYMLKWIPSPLRTVSRYVKERIMEELGNTSDYMHSSDFMVDMNVERFAEDVVERERKENFPKTINLTDVDEYAHGAVTIQWGEICETYAQLFRNAIHETEYLPEGILNKPIEVINGGFSYDWKIIRSAYEDCGLFKDLHMYNTQELAKGACAYLAAQNGITEQEIGFPYLNYDVTAYTLHEKVLLLNHHQYLPKTAKQNITVKPDNKSILVDYGGNTVLHAIAEISEATEFQINVRANKDYSFDGFLINQATGERIDMEKGFGGIKEEMHYQKISFVEPSGQDEQPDPSSEDDQESIALASNHYMVKRLCGSSTESLAILLEDLVSSGAKDQADIKKWLRTETTIEMMFRVLKKLE